MKRLTTLFVQLCETLTQTIPISIRLVRLGVHRRQVQLDLPQLLHCLQYRKLTDWQSPSHSEKHIAALRNRSETGSMEKEQSQATCDGVEDDRSRKKPQFGTRFLTDPQNVFQHNAWDNVVWDDEQEAEARQKTLEQLKDALSTEKQEEYEREADLNWDKFYNQHQNRFFKDRHWLFTEFPELYSSQGNTNPETSSTSTDTSPSASLPVTTTTERQSKDSAELSQDECCSVSEMNDPLSNYSGISTSSEDLPQSVGKAENGIAPVSDSASTTDSYPGESATFRILEVGCGVGNTVFPVLSTNNDPGLMVYCCDFSSTAVQLVRDHHDYDPKRCHAFVWDITDEESKLPFPPESLDIVIMIFVLSAVHPEKMQRAVNRLASCLKPGGQILLRDYGRYDMAQLRFKKGRCLAENFYVRGDGTRVYFFTQEEFRTMFQQAGLEEVQNLIDRRLQVNRGRQLKMYRVWIQCKYRKSVGGAPSTEHSSS